MAERLFKAGLGLRMGLGLVAGAALCAHPGVQAQDLANAPEPTHAIKPRTLSNRLPDKPSQPPAFTIPVDPLGFSSPASSYIGQRNSFISLDFLDENRLLFTFRVPGLIHRDSEAREAGDSTERQIRAVILTLPAGTVQAEALWTVHDRARYLWMLKDGRFLLRDRENLAMGDASLELKPYLRFPGPLLWLEMDPAHQFLVTDSREPAAAAKAGEVPMPASAEAGIEVDGQRSAGDPSMVVRILRRDSGQVMLVSRIRSTVHLPINSDGYLESLRGKGNTWLLNLTNFSGGSATLGQVESTCEPLLDFLSQREVLVTACTSSGARMLVAMGTDGRKLWEAMTSQMAVWPLLVKAPDGSRLAREALVVPRAINARSTLDPPDVKGQLIEVLDAADGNVALEIAASPVLDAGGNISISPSGRRVAVLSGGAIQVFELPPPPPFPEAAAHSPEH